MKEFLEEREALIKENAKLRKRFDDLEQIWKHDKAVLKRSHQNAEFGRKCFMYLRSMAEVRDRNGMWREVCWQEANALMDAFDEEVARRSRDTPSDAPTA